MHILINKFRGTLQIVIKVKAIWKNIKNIYEKIFELNIFKEKKSIINKRWTNV